MNKKINQVKNVNHQKNMNQPTSVNMNVFKLNVNSIKAVQKTKNQIGNKIYGSLIEDTLHDSPYIEQIRTMRRDRDADKKATAKLIKKAIVEAGLIEDVLDKAFIERKKTDSNYSVLDKLENDGVKNLITPELNKMPIYTGYLSQIKGLGHITSAQLISIIGDVTRFQKPSQLCTYFGCGDVTQSTRKKGVQGNYSPKAKALILGVIGDNFIMQNSPYRVIYDRRMAKTKVTHPEWHHLNPDGTKATGKNMHPKHGYRDAIRVMMKRFIIELWVASYQAKGLNPPTEPYILTQPHHNREPQIVAYQTGITIQMDNSSYPHLETQEA